jgi:hypothetical protein
MREERRRKEGRRTFRGGAANTRQTLLPSSYDLPFIAAAINTPNDIDDDKDIHEDTTMMMSTVSFFLLRPSVCYFGCLTNKYI